MPFQHASPDNRAINITCAVDTNPFGSGMVVSEWFQVFDEAVDSAINGRTDSNPFHDAGQLSGAGVRPDSESAT